MWCDDFGYFWAKFWPEKITSRDGCFLLINNVCDKFRPHGHPRVPNGTLHFTTLQSSRRHRRFIVLSLQFLTKSHFFLPARLQKLVGEFLLIFILLSVLTFLGSWAPNGSCRIMWNHGRSCMIMPLKMPESAFFLPENAWFWCPKGPRTKKHKFVADASPFGRAPLLRTHFSPVFSMQKMKKKCKKMLVKYLWRAFLFHWVFILFVLFFAFPCGFFDVLKPKLCSNGDASGKSVSNDFTDLLGNLAGVVARPPLGPRLRGRT